MIDAYTPARHAAARGHHAGAGRTGRALWLLSTGMLLWNAWRCVSGTHRLRLQGRSSGLNEPLETWEGEGGRPHPEDAAARSTLPA